MDKYINRYLRTRYNTDPEYREAKKAYNRGLYVPRTAKCSQCGFRVNLKKIPEPIPEPFICESCLHPKEKRGRGRPRKVKIDESLPVPPPAPASPSSVDVELSSGTE